MHIKKLIISLPRFINKPVLTFIYGTHVLLWHLNSKSVPLPHLIKVKTILKYAKQYKISTLVETGTYLGETVELTKKYFKHIYTIELNKPLYDFTKRLFQRTRKIKIFLGDSSRVLPKILKTINCPCVFWLDAHYSGGITSKSTKETPIMQELKSVLRNKVKNHVILIDDAGSFTGDNDYPTIKEVKTFVKEFLPKHKINIENDIIRIVPKI